MTKNKKFRTAILFGAMAVLAAGCAPQGRFEWGTYEPALYAYYKSPSERALYEKELVKTIERGRKSGKVAPGLCAELGYIRLENGDIAGAQASFDEEMRLFPESRMFLGGVIIRMSPNGGGNANGSSTDSGSGAKGPST